VGRPLYAGTQAPLEIAAVVAASAGTCFQVAQVLAAHQAPDAAGSWSEVRVSAAMAICPPFSTSKRDWRLAAGLPGPNWLAE